MSAIALLSNRRSLATVRSMGPASIQACQLLFTSTPKSDIDSAAKFIGAIAATDGVARSGQGIGSLIIGYTRNPSVRQTKQTNKQDVY